MEKTKIAEYLKSKGLFASNINGVVTVMAPPGKFDAIKSQTKKLLKEKSYMGSWGISPMRMSDVQTIVEKAQDEEEISSSEVFDIEDSTGQLSFV